jgi:hypothetical protein
MFFLLPRDRSSMCVIYSDRKSDLNERIEEQPEQFD